MHPSFDHLIVVDTEAGGLDPLTHSILSVGLVDWSGKSRLEVFVREPEIVSDPRSMAVNGIDLDWVQANGLTPTEAVDKIEHWLDHLGKRRPLLAAGHNIAFDIAYLRRLYRLAGRPLPRDFSHRTLDTHTLLWSLIVRGVLPESCRGSDGAFDHYGVSPPPELRHTALGDAVATRALIEHLVADLAR